MRDLDPITWTPCPDDHGAPAYLEHWRASGDGFTAHVGRLDPKAIAAHESLLAESWQVNIEYADDWLISFTNSFADAKQRVADEAGRHLGRLVRDRRYYCRHATREAVIAAVRALGVAGVFAGVEATEAEVIAELERGPAFRTFGPCTHHDSEGRCAGHVPGHPVDEAPDAR